MEVTAQFKAARRVGTPLMVIKTFDPTALMSSLQSKVTNGDALVQWDVIRGWRARNKEGDAAIEVVKGINGDIQETMNVTVSAEWAAYLPAGTILFMVNAHRYIDKPEFVQALCNLRDVFKANRRCVVLVVPDIQLPAELQQDMLVLDEALPTPEELALIIDRMEKAAKVEYTPEAKEHAIDALRGLAAFPAEQTVAMATTKSGLNVTELWDRKRQLVAQTKGLGVYKGQERFADIGGCDQIKKFMKRVINGREAPRVIVFIDEGEKMFSGATGPVGDSSGVSQDILGAVLSHMEDEESEGAIFVGPPGAAKSLIAKAVGNEAGIPTIVLDMGAIKGSLVGESEASIRNALKIITAVGGGRSYFIMTCNKIAVLPPELKRRFTSGTFFFDLPSAEERASIWNLFLKKYDLPEQGAITFDDGWTGAEIRNCCRMAYRQSITVQEAAEFIVPVSRSASQAIEKLRREAHNNYLSANHSGEYQFAGMQPVNSEPTQTHRHFELEN